MRLKTLTILLALFAISCNNQNNSKIERDGEPTVYQTFEDDAEMNEAVNNARQTFHQFLEAIKVDHPDCGFFTVKMPFDTDQGTEHIWLTNIVLKDNKYFGVVDNAPVFTSEVQLGDTILIVKEKVSDWIYFEKDVMHGAFTVNLLRSRMSDDERKAFDKENGFN